MIQLYTIHEILSKMRIIAFSPLSKSTTVQHVHCRTTAWRLIEINVCSFMQCCQHGPGKRQLFGYKFIHFRNADSSLAVSPDSLDTHLAQNRMHRYSGLRKEMFRRNKILPVEIKQKLRLEIWEIWQKSGKSGRNLGNFRN